MKIDTYTKVILTIIAIALSLNVVKGLVSTATAGNNRFATIPVNPDGSINCKLVKGSDEIDVNIADVSSTAFNLAEPLEVKLHGEPIRVEVER